MKNRRLYLLQLILILSLLSLFGCAKEEIDLVNVGKLDPSIIIDLRYATANNFLGDTLYSANICLLRQDVARRLVLVQQDLQKQNLSLKIWDGYRPLSVQKKMWARLPDANYVADPKTGSNHNRGAAVDVTLVDADGNELEMPTEFDDFSERAAAEYPDVSEAARKNRELLQTAMKKQGFEPIRSEWWHFNDRDIKKYAVMDIPLDYFENKK